MSCQRSDPEHQLALGRRRVAEQAGRVGAVRRPPARAPSPRGGEGQRNRSPGATRSPMMKASAGMRRLPSRCTSVTSATVPPPQRTAIPAVETASTVPGSSSPGAGLARLEPVDLEPRAAEVA